MGGLGLRVPQPGPARPVNTPIGLGRLKSSHRKTFGRYISHLLDGSHKLHNNVTPNFSLLDKNNSQLHYALFEHDTLGLEANEIALTLSQHIKGEDPR